MARHETQRTTVLVADDHPLYREAVVRAVRSRPEFELVGEAGDGREALDAIRADRPDVAVLDVEMPSLRGIEIVEALRRDGVATRVVLLSAHLESDMVYEAVAGGVAAYLSKAAPGDRICDAIAAVARGEVILPAEVQAGLASEIRLRSDSARPALSPREREVLALIAEGLTAPAVGRELHLSTATVKSHLKTLYEKLGVSDRAAAVAEAMRRGLLE
ncbi:MAG TPA: response regulator transcription factor [Solirubrobacteraceae bacterium]